MTKSTSYMQKNSQSERPALKNQRQYYIFVRHNSRC